MENTKFNFNNMIPVMSNNYEEMDLKKKTDNKNEKSRLILLNLQIRWLNQNRETVLSKSKNLHKLYKKNLLQKNVMDRCCNFPLLEEKCMEYNKK